MRKWMILLSVLVAALMAVALSGVTTADPGQTQPRRTRVPGSIPPTPDMSSQRPTLDSFAAQATAQALATSAAGGMAGAEATAQALWDYAAAGGNPDAIVATAEAFATLSAVDAQSVEAAVTALVAEIPADWYAEYNIEPADLELLLNGWLSMGNIGVRWEGDALVATITYSETGLNALLDSAMTLGEYPVDDANVDLIPGGALVDLYGLSAEATLSGDLSLEMLLTAAEGRIEIELVSAALNGRQVPPPALDEIEALLADMAGAFNQALALADGVSYSVDELIITDSNFTAVVTILGVP